MNKQEMIIEAASQRGWCVERWSDSDSSPIAFLDGWFEIASVDEESAQWLSEGEQGTVALHVPAVHDELRELYGPDKVVAVLSRLKNEGCDHHTIVKYVDGLRRVDDLRDRINTSELFYEKISLLGSTAYVDLEHENQNPSA